MRIPAYSEKMMANVEQPSGPGLWLVQSTGRTNPVMVARAVVDDPKHQIPVRVQQGCHSLQGEKIASLQQVEEASGLSISAAQLQSESPQDMLWEMVATGEALDSEEREQLYCLLMEYADIFATNSKDL